MPLASRSASETVNTMSRSKQQQLTIDGRELSLSNQEKILFPDGPITKAQVINYYLRIADVLPHVEDRPVTLKRYPNGALGNFFYEKDAPHLPGLGADVLRSSPGIAGQYPLHPD
jgi:bifunctional non-homologous end joining protein LigD